MSRPDWRGWAREALERGPDCPGDETLRTWAERDEAAADENDEIGAHVSRCPRCRLEADEMRRFFSVPEDGDPGALEIERALRASLSGGQMARPGPPAPAYPARRPGLLAWAGLAAAGIAAALLIALWPERPPALPVVPPGPGSLRGTEAPIPVAPIGDVRSAPERLAWRPAAGSAGPWTVSLDTVDGETIWSATATSAEVTLPEAARRALRPGSRYVWRVAGPGGGKPAASGSFRILPTPGAR